MLRYLITFLIGSCFSVVWGNSSKICDDLHKFSCAPGDYDDGTGVARNSSLSESNSNALQTEMIKTLNTKFKEAVNSPDNKYFVKIALSTLGLSNSPFCELQNNKYSEKCRNDIVQGLTDQALKDISGSNSLNLGVMGGGLGFPHNKSLQISDVVLLSGNPVYKEIKSIAFEKARTKISDEDVLNKIRDKIFPDIKSRIIAKIKKYVKDEKKREILIDKVTAIRWNGKSCFGSEESQNLPLFLTPNAFYLPDANTFTVCSGLIFNNKSEFQLANVVAHELSHAIDPCGITIGPEDFKFDYTDKATKEQAESEYPFENIISCLRGANSVEAKRFNRKNSSPYGFPMPAPPMPGSNSNYYYGEYNVGANNNNTEDEFNGFCGGIDQIGESFSDWMAAEVLPEYIRENHKDLSKEQSIIGYSNVWRGMCVEKSNTGTYTGMFDVHPNVEFRVNRILLAHPDIRQQMGCSENHAKYTHCNPELSTAEAADKPKSQIGGRGSVK